MKVFLFLAVISLSWMSFASPAYLPVPKRIGASNTPVYFASAKAEVLKKSKSHTFYSLDVILKWGINAFEKGQLIYKCQNIRAACQVVDYRAHQSYIECRKYREKVKCSGTQSSEISASEKSDPHLDPASPFKDGDDLREDSDSQFEEPLASEERNPHFEEVPSTELPEPELH